MSAHAIKLAEGVDVSPLLAEIEAHPELWNAHSARRDAPGSPHTQMSDIWVRYNHPSALKDPSTFNDEHFPVWYPAWEALPSLRQIVFSLMSATEGEHLGGVLITKIPPGCNIEPHIDRSWHVDFYNCKCYLSLKSSPGADFVLDYADGQVVLNPRPGEIYRIDNRERHWVVNNSSDDRMTLIVCIRSQQFDGYDISGVC
jgi:hypothetical protein